MSKDFLGDNFPFNNFDEEKEDEEVLKQMVDKDIITGIEKNIKELGHKRAWELIERFGNALIRKRYRECFFKAGGKMPKQEILEEREGKLFIKGE